MKKSVKIYNQYLEETSYDKRNNLYNAFQKECIKERLEERISKMSLGNSFFELFILPFALFYFVLFD